MVLGRILDTVLPTEPPAMGPSPYKRYSQDGFQPLTAGSHDVTIDIPMEHIDRSHSRNGITSAEAAYNHEKAVVASYKDGGYRRSMKLGGHQKDHHHRGIDGERDSISQMGVFYDKVRSFSIVTRYLMYVLPLGLVFLIPIVIGATVAKDANIGGVSMMWFFIWVECSWVGLWYVSGGYEDAQRRS